MIVVLLAYFVKRGEGNHYISQNMNGDTYTYVIGGRTYTVRKVVRDKLMVISKTQLIQELFNDNRRN